MTTVGNIGIGLLILIIIWIVALLVFVFAVKRENNLGWIALAVATILTVTLVILPVDGPPDKDLQDKYTQDKDNSYIYRVALLLFLIVSATLGLFSVFILHCVEPVRPKPTKSF